MNSQAAFLFCDDADRDSISPRLRLGLEPVAADAARTAADVHPQRAVAALYDLVLVDAALGMFGAADESKALAVIIRGVDIGEAFLRQVYGVILHKLPDSTGKEPGAVFGDRGLIHHDAVGHAAGRGEGGIFAVGIGGCDKPDAAAAV